MIRDGGRAVQTSKLTTERNRLTARRTETSSVSSRIACRDRRYLVGAPQQTNRKAKEICLSVKKVRPSLDGNNKLSKTATPMTKSQPFFSAMRRRGLNLIVYRVVRVYVHQTQGRTKLAVLPKSSLVTIRGARADWAWPRNLSSSITACWPTTLSRLDPSPLSRPFS